MHWHIFVPRPGGEDLHLRFPKAWEIGLVSTLAERTTAAMLGDPAAKDMASKFLHAVMTVEHLDVIPGALGPIEEVRTGTNRLTGHPLMSEQTAKLQPWAQANPHTSPALRRLGEMERSLPASMQVSPITAETLLRGYFGNWADMALLVTDTMMGGPPRPDRRLDEMPLVRRFYEQTPAKSTRHVTDFYSAL